MKHVIASFGRDEDGIEECLIVSSWTRRPLFRLTARPGELATELRDRGLEAAYDIDSLLNKHSVEIA